MMSVGMMLLEISLAELFWGRVGETSQKASPEVIREMEHMGDFSPMERVVWLVPEQDWFGRLWRRLTSNIFGPSNWEHVLRLVEMM